MNESCVIGIDVGTSGVRVVAMLRDETILSEAQCRFSDLGEDHRSPEIWWQGVVTALKQLLSNISSVSVVAISVDGTSGTVLPVDENGKWLAQPMMYNDAVADDKILNDIKNHMPATSAAGGVTSGLAKALIFRDLKPAGILHQADWVLGKFAEKYLFSDANNALKTGYDPVAGIWPDWIRDIGMDLSLLPEVVIPGTGVVNISNSMAELFNLSSDVLLVAGTTDGCASFLATGASKTGDAVTALGSTMTLKILSENPVFVPEFGVYSHIIGDRWLAGGASNTGGKVLDTYFQATELDALSKCIDPNSENNLDYYPLTKPGERFPINDPDMMPKVTPRPDSDAQFLQGLLQGMTNIESLGYQVLEDHGAPKLRSMRTVGGGANNQVWTSMRRRVLGVPFESTHSVQAAAGTARLALAGATASTKW